MTISIRALAKQYGDDESTISQSWVAQREHGPEYTSVNALVA